jgi:NAD+ synthase (glutamine-hydrolysing)
VSLDPQLRFKLSDPTRSFSDFKQTLASVHTLIAKNSRESLIHLAACAGSLLTTAWTVGADQAQDTKRKLSWLLDVAKDARLPYGNGLIAMGQFNPSPGNLAANATKIMRMCQLAEALQVDVIAFPELALMGYPVRDIIVRHPFLVKEQLKWLQAIAEQLGNTRAIIGFVEPNGPPGEECKNDFRHPIGKPYFNAAAICGNGTVEALVRKCLLPTYGEYEESRTFEAALQTGILPPEYLGQGQCPQNEPIRNHTIHGHSYGISICEDLWNDAQFFDRPLYALDPIEQLLHHAPETDVLINLSASVSRSRKEQMKHNLVSHVAKRHQRPLVYVNQVGAIDECSFDGASRCYDEKGQLVARALSFQEDFAIVCPLASPSSKQGEAQPLQGLIEPLSPGLGNTLSSTPSKRFDPNDPHDLGRTFQTLVQGIRDYFTKTGFQRALLGLSGGLDSSVTVALLVEALGAKNVLGVLMPSDITPSENQEDVQALVHALGVPSTTIPIANIVSDFLADLTLVEPPLGTVWGLPDPHSNAAENVQAMNRATLLRLLGNQYRALPIATSDKSELYLGYATVNGDMSGALAPLGDVPKTKVRALGRWMNAYYASKGASREVIPERILSRPPGADLKLDPQTGKTITAESVLMPYEFADEIIWRIEALHQSMDEMKATPFYWEERHGALGTSQKQEWLERFYTRMRTAVFKWWVVPPIILVEGNGSITKTDYHHPITAASINWQSQSAETIKAALQAEPFHAW